MVNVSLAVAPVASVIATPAATVAMPLEALINLVANNEASGIGGGQLTAVPDPATLTLCVIGLSVLAMRRVRSHSNRSFSIKILGSMNHDRPQVRSDDRSTRRERPIAIIFGGCKAQSTKDLATEHRYRDAISPTCD